jgi:uncharacterized protein GlcG (DUF336 family)
MANFFFKVGLVSTLVLATAACGSGGGGGGGSQSGGSDGANFGCDGGCAHQLLTTGDVTRILRQAATSAQRANTAGSFAVVDRVGNVLAVYQMNGAPTTTTINGQIGAGGGLEGATVPATLAAISKAGTGAYLSSQGNAFSTRTASQIIQEHFLPGQANQPGGPLFGVQFSQLGCGDVMVKGGGSAGPRPLPLGLAGDPGGLPLYKNGDLVGGIGVEFDGLYTVDRDTSDHDYDPEERVALAASVGFEAPSERVGDNISVAGRTLRFADISYAEIVTPEVLDDLETGGLRSVPGYCRAEIRSGVTFGTAQSGVADTSRAGVLSGVLVGRFPTRAGRGLPGGAQLAAHEVDAILDSALRTASRTRAAIRTPRDTAARVSIFVVDDQGAPLGFTRSQDAPVFGIDVSLQKARAAALLSSPDAGSVLSRGRGFGRNYSGEYAAFSGVPLDGRYALSARAIGNMARPFLPDGIDGTAPGPFSLPFPGVGNTWSPFNTGLQFDISAGGLLGALANPGAGPSSCDGGSGLGNRARNGIQIFPGGVPLYRNGTFIGAVGVSGDGIDQDDLVAFYGASRKGLDYVGHTTVGDPQWGFNAPPEKRSDQINLPQPQLRLRYVNCPEAPFIADNDQNACEGQ